MEQVAVKGAGVASKEGFGVQFIDIPGAVLAARIAAFHNLYGYRPLVQMRGIVTMGEYESPRMLQDWTKAIVAQNGYSAAIVVNGDVEQVGQYRYEEDNSTDPVYYWQYVRLIALKEVGQDDR